MTGNLTAVHYQFRGIAKTENVGYCFPVENKDINQALQKNLMRIIEERYGGNQAAFCRDLDFNPTYINAVVRGKKNLGKQNWEKIRKALDLRPDEFLQSTDRTVVQNQEEQQVMDWYREIKSAGMTKEAELMMEYLKNAAKKKDTTGAAGKGGGISRRAHRRAG